jgi:hypothetical protein
MMTELQTRFRQYFSTPLRRRPFDDDYEPCMKHMQRGWIKQVQYEDLNMRQANMLFKSARNCFSEAQRPFARVCKSLAATPFSCQVSTL